LPLIEYLVSFGVAILVSAALLPAVIRGAHRWGAVDLPGGRRPHTGEIARLGGIGIYAGFVGGVGCALLLGGQAPSLGDPSAEFPWAGAGLGATIVFLAGLMGDFRQFSPRVKFAFQLLAAGIAVAFGVSIDSVSAPLGGTFALGAASPVVTILWILLVTNAMNLIDGLDGLAGGLALISTTCIACVSIASGQFGVSVCAVGLAGALLGFLRFNFSPARIFMGDGGSQFLGFVLAIISIRASSKGATAVALAMPVLMLGVPLLDLTTTVVRRAFRGEGIAALSPASFLRRISKADREHLHHNLLELGWSPRRAVLTLYLLAAVLALTGWLTIARHSLTLVGLLLVLCLGSVAAIKFALVGTRAQESVDPQQGEP